MRMSEMGRLMPYHSNVSPSGCAETLEALRSLVRAGYLTMHRFADGRRGRETCMFRFRGREGAPSAFICAGGGMRYVASIHEGFPLAMRLASKGYNAFVVNYRVDDMGSACKDLSSAVGMVLEDADGFGADPERYSTWGSSAGARIAAYVGSYGPSGFIGGDLPRPDTVVMAYTGMTDWSRNDPPTFAVVGTRDGVAPPSSVRRRTESLRSAGIDAEMMLVDGVGHGFGLGTGTPAEGWADRAESFWKRHLRRVRNPRKRPDDTS